MSRVRRLPPTAKPNVLLSFFLHSVFPAPTLAFVLAPTFHVVIDRGLRGLRACRCLPRMDAFFAFLSSRRQGPGYSASSRSVKSKSLSPSTRFRFDGDCEFYSVLYTLVCIEKNALTQFENPFGDSFKDVISSGFVADLLLSMLYFSKVLFKS